MSSLAGLLVALTVKDERAQREGLQTGKASGSTDELGASLGQSPTK